MCAFSCIMNYNRLCLKINWKLLLEKYFSSAMHTLGAKGFLFRSEAAIVSGTQGRQCTIPKQTFHICDLISVICRNDS